MTEGEKAGEVSVAEATRSDTGGSPGGSAGKSQSQALFDEKVSAGETKEAVRLLRAESELDISKDQAWRLLDSIPLDVSEENETEQQILVSLTYAALRKRELLTGFGVVPVSPEALPLASKEVDVAGLEATLGMGMAALTPKSSSMPWTVLGFGLFGAEFALAQQLGYDPMRTVVPVSALAFVLDRVVLSGAIFESVSRLLFPAYKRKVIQHEAGHFLLAYLLGCPIQGFFLSAWDASNAGIRGQAGTVFFDNDLSSQVCVSDCRACMCVCVCVCVRERERERERECVCACVRAHACAVFFDEGAGVAAQGQQGDADRHRPLHHRAHGGDRRGSHHLPASGGGSLRRGGARQLPRRAVAALGPAAGLQPSTLGRHASRAASARASVGLR